MGLRDSLPAPWLVATVALAGLAGGVLWGRREAWRAAPEKPPAEDAAAARGRDADPDARAPGAPRVFEIPGGPPPGVARAMEEAILGAFRGDPDDPALRASRDEAFARVRELTAAWAASSPRPPLASTVWWKAALGRALPVAGAGPRGPAKGSIPFLGRELPYALHVPEGTGPFPAILAAIEGSDTGAAIERAYGPLLRTHLVAAMAPDETLAGDPRTLLLALAEAARRWPVDLDRVALDGVGAGAAVAADLAADASRQFCGAVLRDLEPSGPRPAGTGLFPVLAPGVRLFGGLKEASLAWPLVKFLPEDDPAAVREWIADLPPRRCADPRNPCAWETVTGDLYRSWGPWFVVRKVRDRRAGRPVRVAISRDAARNAVVLRTENVEEILLLLNDEGLDLGQPVKVVADGIVVEERRVARSLDVVRNWASQGEPTLFVTAELVVALPE